MYINEKERRGTCRYPTGKTGNALKNPFLSKRIAIWGAKKKIHFHWGGGTVSGEKRKRGGVFNQKAHWTKGQLKRVPSLNKVLVRHEGERPGRLGKTIRKTRDYD